MDTTYTFRRAVIDDEKQVMHLGLISYGQYKTILTEEHWQKMSSNFTGGTLFRELILNAHGIVCEHDGRIVGMAFLIPSGNPTHIFKAEWSYIRMVGIDPEFSGRGIARRLTGLCIEQATNSGEKIIALHTSEFMDAARHIYESLGFEKLMEIEPIHGKRYWVYTMELIKDS
jgi:ribosomal protein S18 acetylase RimI-like enzyme